MMDINIGDIVRISNDEGEHFDSVVLFLSSHFKNVMLLGMPFKSDADSLALPELLNSIQVLVYTSKESVIEGPWEVVRSVNLSDCECLSERIDGDSIWVGDTRLRKRANSDSNVFPLMRVAGEGVVESIVSQLNGSLPVSKFTTSSIRLSKALFDRVRITTRQ